MNANELKDGVYEQVISEQLDRYLKNDELWARIEQADPQEAAIYLSDYVGRLVQCCLKDIADRDEKEEHSLEEERALTNQLIALLVSRNEGLGEGHRIPRNDFLLMELKHRRNELQNKVTERPLTSLTHSFLFTNSQKDASLVSELQKEIMSSDRIDFLVSFIKYSGYTMLRPYLRNFVNKGGKLRVITTTYMGATDPKAIAELASLPNTEVRISYHVQETRLHAKSYIFYRESGFSTAYIGSSNLSHAAIADGLEWNVKVTQQDMPLIMDKIRSTFETYWHSEEFQPFTTDQEDRLREEIDRQKGRDPSGKRGPVYTFQIRPYAYQQVILDSLEAERKERNRWHNLIVAATGTGKTAIAAFDYRRFARERAHIPTRLLFIAHREEILKQSLSCFRQVMQDPDFGGLYVGSSKTDQPEHLFISIQSFDRLRLWEKMDPDYYDMIIVDEFHHAAAPSYQKLLSYFKPTILLGLTATPERMDGENILRYFDGHIAAEIRLSDAIERRFLCPFHYFGVEDPIDLKGVNWVRGHYDVDALNNLYVLSTVSAERRAAAILNAIDRYTPDLRDIRGLGFCVSVRHAHFMADYFNAHGVPSLALDSHTPEVVREAARGQLARGELTFLFAVDLFNEGVDIPEINTVLFLRPTNSMTIFLQQLGRGLRRAEGKDCLTVLDFVAQANRKYDFAGRFQALSGSRHIAIQSEIKNGFPHVPKGCCIQLEQKAQEWVLSNIRNQMRGSDYYKSIIKELYDATGGTQMPSLAEFLKAASVDPRIFYNGKRSYAHLCEEVKTDSLLPYSETEEHLSKAFPRILSMDSPQWLSWLQKAFSGSLSVKSPVEYQFLRMWQFTIWNQDYLQTGFMKPEEAVTSLTGQGSLTTEIQELLAWQYEHFNMIPKKAALLYPCALEIYCHYTRDQIFAALGFEKPTSIREGVKYLDAGNSSVVTTPTDIFLVTLNKSSKEFSETTRYEDYSIDARTFHWQSQSTTTPESKTGRRYLERMHKKNGFILLFVRESKYDACHNAMPYTFLGTASMIELHGSQPMTALLRLDEPIPAKYITQTDCAGVL